MMEGESVALNTGVTEVQKYYLIQWMFGETQIAEISRLSKSSSIYGSDDDTTLKDRLQLDPQTASLTITNTRTTDSGLYQLILSGGETRCKSFSVTVSGEKIITLNLLHYCFQIFYVSHLHLFFYN